MTNKHFLLNKICQYSNIYIFHFYDMLDLNLTKIINVLSSYPAKCFIFSFWWRGYKCLVYQKFCLSFNLTFGTT